MKQLTDRQTYWAAGIAAAIGVIALGFYAEIGPNKRKATQPAYSAATFDLRGAYRLSAEQRRNLPRDQVLNTPECANEYAALKFFEACIELFKVGPDVDCGTLAEHSPNFAIPRDFEHAQWLKIQNYRNAPDACQKGRNELSALIVRPRKDTPSD